MQTFLPYSDLKKSLESLDHKRLGKQRVESFQLLNALLGRPSKSGKLYKGWINHPICKMWKNDINGLKHYYNLSLDIWIGRGYNNTMKKEDIEGEITMPVWFGDEKFHSSHRANLLRKDFEFYSKYGWIENSSDPYQWYNMDSNSWYTI